MNRHLRDMTTTAAEGLPRRRFTVAELERMTEAGILEEDERIELIGGEIVPMSPKGNQHEVLKTALTRYWVKRIPDDLQLTTVEIWTLNEGRGKSRRRDRPPDLHVLRWDAPSLGHSGEIRQPL